MSPTLLAIETSTEACSVAICHRDRIETEHEIVPRQHNRWVLGMIERVMARADARRTDLDAIAFGCGPGSFTGTRIAAAIAQGLALALDRLVVRVATPDILAHTAWRHAPDATGVLTVFASRAAEVYVAGYAVEDTRLTRVIEPCTRQLARFGAESAITAGWRVAGDRCIETCRLEWASTLGLRPVIEAQYPDARDLLALARHELAAGRAVSAEAALPIYLEDAQPWKKVASPMRP